MSPSPAQRTAVNRPKRFGAAAALVLPLIFGLLALSDQVHRVPPHTGPAGAKPSEGKLFNGLLLVYGRHTLTAVQVRSVVRGGGPCARTGRTSNGWARACVDGDMTDGASLRGRAVSARRPAFGEQVGGEVPGRSLRRLGATSRTATL
jgi:hypothetical protein